MFDPSVKVAEKNWLSEIFCCFFNNKYDPKAVNPVYATFKGGYGGWNANKTEWDYFCLWGYLRFCYDRSHTRLKDDWIHISLHGYKYGYTYTPVKLPWFNFDWHIAYRKKWPFIKIGFNRIWPLFKDV